MQETLAPSASVSAVARRHGVNPNQVFGWRKQYQEGSLAAVQAGETVVPASELAAAIKEIKELQLLLGKKTMEVEILKEAVDGAAQQCGTGSSRLITSPQRFLDALCGKTAAITSERCSDHLTACCGAKVTTKTATKQLA